MKLRVQNLYYLIPPNPYSFQEKKPTVAMPIHIRYQQQEKRTRLKSTLLTTKTEPAHTLMQQSSWLAFLKTLLVLLHFYHIIHKFTHYFCVFLPGN